MAELTTEQKEARAANKAARLAAEEVARQARDAQYAAEEAARLAAMPMTLLALMARSDAVALDYRVYAMPDAPELSVEFHDKYGDPTRLVLTSNDYDVQQVDNDIASKEFEVEEARKKAARRNEALSKLTADDRKALGI